MTTYRGTRDEQGFNCVVTADGEMLDPRFDLRNHSPTGFQWGYNGSGPAQLALALLAHATQDDEIAQQLYQAFKETSIAIINSNEWYMTDTMINVWVGMYQEYLVHKERVESDNKVTKIPSFKVPYSGNA